MLPSHNIPLRRVIPSPVLQHLLALQARARNRREVAITRQKASDFRAPDLSLLQVDAPSRDGEAVARVAAHIDRMLVSVFRREEASLRLLRVDGVRVQVVELQPAGDGVCVLDHDGQTLDVRDRGILGDAGPGGGFCVAVG
jgi:non-ribosomal peptide synthetase component E (peptide arylation enzyme)